MTLIRIRERGGAASLDALLSFDHGAEFPIAVADPFSKDEEARLEWYFEDHLRFPFIEKTKAREAAESVTAYGERLFAQVFTGDHEAYAHYARARQQGDLRIEVAGSPDFHRLHWEALKDPRLPRPLALEFPLVRKNLVPRPVQAEVPPSPTVNVLVVVARPRRGRDVGYRTISRPLVEGLRQSPTPVRIHILRPGTYRALVEHLEQVREDVRAGRRPAAYHIVHFDVHGSLLTHDELKQGFQGSSLLYQTRFARDDLEPFARQKAFLFLEHEKKEDVADPVEAQELADLLLLHKVPIVALNACQSGKQVGATETSLGSRLLKAGCQLVIGMGYSITVTAARLFMTTLYEKLFQGADLASAVRLARGALANEKGRRAYFNQTVDLEDWLLPVAYENREVRLARREFTADEQTAHYAERARRFPSPEPRYGFFGRDLDILEIERRVLALRNILLVRGMGGAGKTTLLRHIAAWWQTTGFVGDVKEFAYDERAWTRDQILRAIADAIFTPVERAKLDVMGPGAQQELIAERLRAKRHLLVLDNLESITGSELAIQHTLPAKEQESLRSFLHALSGGQTIVLLGSRGGEPWLAPGTFENNVYELPGLDPEAASTLADRILERNDATRHRTEADFRKLMKILAGYPLALEVVLPNLRAKSPTEVLQALEAGEVDELDKGDAEKKTESILRCIDYSLGILSPEAQPLLLCLAPFTGVVIRELLPQFSERLKAHADLADLPFDRWEEVLEQAADRGLVSPHPEISSCLRLQPILPYFLRGKLQADESSRRAIEAAFLEVYQSAGAELRTLLRSKDATERRAGQILGALEFENLWTAVSLGLAKEVPILPPYQALSGCLDATHDEERGLELGERVLAGLAGHPPDALSGALEWELIWVLDDVARRRLNLRRFEEAKTTYERVLDLLAFAAISPEERRRQSASVSHQLGIVAQQQRRWKEARDHFKNALKIRGECDDRQSQADTLHQLGVLAIERRRWGIAKRYLMKALRIDVEFDSRPRHATTYEGLGRIAAELRRWEEAEKHYNKALEFQKQFGDRLSQAPTYHQLGIVAQAQGRLDEARGFYEKAFVIYFESGDRYEQAGTYHQLGRVAEEQGKYTEAREAFFRAWSSTLSAATRVSS